MYTEAVLTVEVGSSSVGRLMRLAEIVGEAVGLLEDQVRADRIRAAALAEIDALLAVAMGGCNGDQPKRIAGSGGPSAGGVGSAGA